MTARDVFLSFEEADRLFPVDADGDRVGEPAAEAREIASAQVHWLVAPRAWTFGDPDLTIDALSPEGTICAHVSTASAPGGFEVRFFCDI